MPRLAFALAPIAILGLFYAQAGAAADPPRRQAWTTSRITGAPEPPPPYLTPRVFPKLQFTNPLELVYSTALGRWAVVEQHGRILTFADRQDAAQAELLIDISKDLKTVPADAVVGDTYGLAFHPEFAKNRYCYICYVINGKNGEQLPAGSRLSRFKVTDTDPPRCDPASEKIVITWPGGGHNGGSLKFGPDRMLYISTGDGGNPNPPDPRDTGQDISDLLSSILRIDIDHESQGQAYKIPDENPFVKTPGARGEVWAYGLRNPWRMSFDRQTGELWVGDVGWELWEMIDRIQKGGNYGWSVMEGPQAVHPDGKRGPTPLSPPNFYFRHTDAASITGGFVYRGQRLKELVGQYICGDWETRRMWAIQFEDGKAVKHREIAQNGPRIVAFGESGTGELYILDYDVGTIHELQPNPERAANTAFPTRLSETGLFASVAEHKPAPGVVPFDIVAPQWADYATAERFIALPGAGSVDVFREPPQIAGSMFHQQMKFPKDGVLAKTFSLEMERGNPASKRRLETQILHYDGRGWRGYTYRWNDEQTDAKLVGPGGEDRELVVKDAAAPGGKRIQTWRYSGRQECFICHNPWADTRLAFNLPQLAVKDQISRLKSQGLINCPVDRPEQAVDRDGKPYVPLVNPQDTTASLEARARSYLSVNCSHCHQFGAGGTAEIELRPYFPADKMHAIGDRPKQGDFGIPGAAIIQPGDPYHSTLFFRVMKLGPGRMPHIGSQWVDDHGVELLHDWITKLSPKPDRTPMDEAQKVLDVFTEIPAAQRKKLLDELFQSRWAALRVAYAMRPPNYATAVCDEVASYGYAHADSRIRDLFERFIPAEQRIKRLGADIDVAKLLVMPANEQRGRDLFLGASLSCKNCHRIGEQGGQVAPELTHLGKKLSRGQILDKLLNPSKAIDPKFAAYTVHTADGKSYIGVLVEKSSKQVTLRDAENKEIRLPADQVEQLIKLDRSLMPEGMLRELTAQQAADLLEFLQSLK